MVKKLSVLLVLVLVIGALSACVGSGIVANHELTDEKKDDILRAYFTYSYTIDLVVHGEAKGDNYYIGRYDGKDIVYLSGYGFLGYLNGAFTDLDGDTCAFLRKVVTGEAEIPSDFSKEKKAEIERKWRERGIALFDKNPERYRPLWGDEENSGTWRYLGTCNQYDIVLCQGQIGLGIPESVTIASETFRADDSFLLCGYKNNMIYDLKELYEDGEISAAAIKTIAQLYKKHYPEQYE